MSKFIWALLEGRSVYINSRHILHIGVGTGLYGEENEPEEELYEVHILMINGERYTYNELSNKEEAQEIVKEIIEELNEETED